MTKSALVLGARGFIGSSVVKELLSEGYDVVSGVRNPESYGIDVPCVKYEIGNIDTIADIVKNDVDYVFDFAWAGTSGSGRADYSLQMSNVTGAMDIVKLCAKHGVRYVGAGSMMENESVKCTLDNRTSISPNLYYSNAKYMAHAFAKIVAKECNGDIVWGKITNAYGPGEISNRLIYTTLKKILHGIVPEFTSGVQIYDFIFISDLARGFRMIAESGRNGYEYTFGSGNPRPLREYLQIINRTIAPHMEFVYGAMSAGIALSAQDYDTSETTADTGFVPEVDFESGIKITYDWIKETKNESGTKL